jgi:uncharacterized protein YndB with AHSA1/START domain
MAVPDAGRSTGTAQTQARELVITRVFDAPRDVVWQAWTDRDQAIQWWGPKDFTARILEWGTKPGDAWRAVIRSPQGEEFPQHGVLQEVVPPERLAYTFIWDREADQGEMLVTVTLAERGANRTEMTFRKGPFVSADWQKGEEGGWNETFDRLAALVTSRG